MQCNKYVLSLVLVGVMTFRRGPTGQKRSAQIHSLPVVMNVFIHLLPTPHFAALSAHFAGFALVLLRSKMIVTMQNKQKRTHIVCISACK